MKGDDVITGALFISPANSGDKVIDRSETFESVISKLALYPDISPGPPQELSPLISEPITILYVPGSMLVKTKFP